MKNLIIVSHSVEVFEILLWPKETAVHSWFHQPLVLWITHFPYLILSQNPAVQCFCFKTFTVLRSKGMEIISRQKLFSLAKSQATKLTFRKSSNLLSDTQAS